MNIRLNRICLAVAAGLSCYFINSSSTTAVNSATRLNNPTSLQTRVNGSPINSQSTQAAKKQSVAQSLMLTANQRKILAQEKPVWRNNFPTATEISNKITADTRKVGFKRNVAVIIRETLLKTDMKYPNIISEEVFKENENGDLELVGYVEYAADHLLAKIDNSESLEQLKSNFNTLEINKVDEHNLYRVSLNGLDIDTVKKAIASYQSSDSVQYAEADYVMRNASTNDTYYGSLWGLNNTGQSGGVADADIDAPEAWETTTGSRDVIVAVIDTGVDYTHPDLVANIWSNPGETGTDADGNDKATNGIDDDSNGYVDDVHGWDFVNNDNDPMDDNYHGTHCAGTIGASANNNTGVVGVAHKVSIVALKFLSASGSGFTSDAVLSIDYTNTIGVDIRSNSWFCNGY
ncbi:MAG: S8 family serine peptidase [Lentisphaeraceae bacterium]|nr:S8 family serine peptidase [Lentisphaeraceae bacterium]